MALTCNAELVVDGEYRFCDSPDVIYTYRYVDDEMPSDDWRGRCAEHAHIVGVQRGNCE